MTGNVDAIVVVGGALIEVVVTALKG